MSLISSLNTAASGLRVASQGINVTSHNVTNATTEGYSRRSLRVETALPSEVGGFGIGNGANPVGARRSADLFVNRRLVDAIGEESRTASRYQTLRTVEASFEDVSADGPASLLSQFFDSMSRLTQDPSDRNLRSDVLNQGTRFTEGVQKVAADLQTGRLSIFEELSQTVGEVNDRLEQVANFNAAITSSKNEMGAGDFMDKRDQLIHQLADEFGFTAVFNADGSAQVSIGGHAAVTGAEHRELEVLQTAAGVAKVDLETGSGTVDVTDFVGGYFGGRLDSQADIVVFENELNSFVSTLGTAVNTQHAAGFDQTGAPGGAFFTFAAGSEAATFSLDTTLAADPSLIAAAGAATAAAGDGDNLADLVDLESQKLFASGTQTATQALGSVYGSVGRAVLTAEMENSTAAVTLDDLRALRDAASGVDLDEEAADLLAWQASYQAAARVVTTTNQMLAELLEIVR
jgi:flagellar hook-associated protein 1 FlgK